MRILFYTAYRAVATKGGTERTTVSTASALSLRYGHECYSAYSIGEEGSCEASFVEEVQVDANPSLAASQIIAFVQSRRVKAVVCQGVFNMVGLLRDAGLPEDVKLVFSHHFEPGWELHFNDLKEVASGVLSSRGFKRLGYVVKVLGYPAYRKRCERGLRKSYRDAYVASDAVVLLSEGYVEGYKAFGGFGDDGKFRFIPNPLSRNELLDPMVLDEKEKVALIVSRFDEASKKISLALKTWRSVKLHPASEGWTLRVVGHGRDGRRYKRLVERLGIPDVDFVGRRDPVGEGDYCLASLFLMTSVSEGWGLTLTEAQQFGVVPVAFDSCASIREIITDGESGRYVPYADMEAYAGAVLELIEDEGLRKGMALNAIKSSRRFSWDLIAEKWQALLKESENHAC